MAHKNQGQIVLDVNGVGYLVAVSPGLESSLEIGGQISLRTAFIVREDSFSIFGFEDASQLQLFETLRSVNGVGPKLAMTILSQLGVDRIAAAVLNQDDKMFSGVTGIGPKTAKLLTVALEGKIQQVQNSGYVSKNGTVLLALIGLGWPERQAQEALQTVSSQTSNKTDNKDLLRAALSLLANDRSQSVKP